MQNLRREQQLQLLLLFAARVRMGEYGRRKQIRVGFVDVALRAVGQTFALAGHPDPRRSSQGTKELDLPISLLLKRYKDLDPATCPELAVPVEVVEYIAVRPRTDEFISAVNDLVELQFLFLLRVGEYTLPSRTRQTRTVQFRRRNIVFRSNGFVLPHHTPVHILSQADSVTLCLVNQKNGKKNATLHHQNCAGVLSPVGCCARIVHRCLGISGRDDLHICAYQRAGRRVQNVFQADIVEAVHHGVVATGLLLKGYTLERVGSHSLRAGGAMAMKLNGIDDTRIKQLGRWSGNTFLTYIHTQIAGLMTGVSAKMIRHVPHFINVAR